MSKGNGSSPFSASRVIGGRYRLVKPLGEGAMGVVWRAVNEVTGGEVALKLLVGPEPELRVRLLREARTCCSIRHKNIVQVYDVGELEGGDPFLVMELLSGETLADMLSRRRRLSPIEAATIARDVARALGAAHDKGIIHRDLKPANIFLHHEPGEDAPVVKVLDFGVSKNPFCSDGMRTVPGGAIGSPMYMSPEQVRADASIDGRSDIWSLGIVLYEMLTGMKPFTGDAAEVVRQVVTVDVLPVSRKVRKIDPALEAVVMACLRRPREERPWPAAEVMKRLEPFAHASVRGPAVAAPEPRPSGSAAAVPPPPRPSEDPPVKPPVVDPIALERTLPDGHASLNGAAVAVVHDEEDDRRTIRVAPRRNALPAYGFGAPVGNHGTIPIYPGVVPGQPGWPPPAAPRPMVEVPPPPTAPLAPSLATGADVSAGGRSPARAMTPLGAYSRPMDTAPVRPAPGAPGPLSTLSRQLASSIATLSGLAGRRTKMAVLVGALLLVGLAITTVALLASSCGSRGGPAGTEAAPQTAAPPKMVPVLSPPQKVEPPQKVVEPPQEVETVPQSEAMDKAQKVGDKAQKVGNRPPKVVPSPKVVEKPRVIPREPPCDCSSKFRKPDCCDPYASAKR